MAATLDLTGKYRIEQGADYTMRLRPSSLTLNFTGSTARAQIRKKFSDLAILATFTATNGTDGTGFYIDLALTDDKTAAIPVNSASSAAKRSTLYCYDVEIVLSDGLVIRLIEGQVEVSPEVTK